MNKSLSNRCSLLVCSLFSFRVWADDGNSSTAVSAMLLQTLAGLMVVVLVIYGLAWMAKKLNLMNTGRSQGMTLLGVMPLGSREKAVLVEVAGKQMLLGVAPGRVNTLHVFDSDSQQAQVRDQAPEDNSQDFPSDDNGRNITALAARTTSEFSRKLHSFLGQGLRR